MIRAFILSLVLTSSLSFAGTGGCDTPVAGNQECNQIFLLSGAIYPKAVSCIYGFDSAYEMSINTNTEIVSYRSYDGIFHSYSYTTCGDEVYFTKIN